MRAPKSLQELESVIAKL